MAAAETSAPAAQGSASDKPAEPAPAGEVAQPEETPEELAARKARAAGLRVSVGVSGFRRVLALQWRQTSNNHTCPAGPTPAVEGKVGLITGGHSGIGVEMTRGLLERGMARLYCGTRDVDRATTALQQTLTEEQMSRVKVVHLDMADLACVTPAVQAMAGLGCTHLDVVLLNAAMVNMVASARSPQGFDLSFAANVLGNHALIRLLMARGMLRAGADSRVVIVGADAHRWAAECTPDYPKAGFKAYTRSKLGGMWDADEMRRHFPALRLWVLHPGVIKTNLVPGSSRLGSWIMQRIMMGLVEGAQMALICCTQDVEPGYYHNTLGYIPLSAESGPVHNPEAAATLWEQCEAACAAAGLDFS